MPLTTYYQNALEDHLWGVSTFNPPAAIYVALHTADPGATGSVGEVTDGEYARQVFTTGTGATSGGVRPNDALIQFPGRTNSWGTATHVSIWDSATGGNCLKTGQLGSSKPMPAGVDVSFAIAALNSALT